MPIASHRFELHGSDPTPAAHAPSQGQGHRTLRTEQGGRRISGFQLVPNSPNRNLHLNVHCTNPAIGGVGIKNTGFFNAARFRVYRHNGSGPQDAASTATSRKLRVFKPLQTHQP